MTIQDSTVGRDNSGNSGLTAPHALDEQKYSTLAIAFHWLTLALLIAQFWLGFTGLDEGPQQLRIITLHKSLGVMIWLVVALRLGWRATHPAPRLPSDLPNWQKIVARGNQFLLYAILLGQPIGGWLYSNAAGYPVNVFNLFTLPKLLDKDPALAKQLFAMHGFSGWALIVLASIHAAAALYHHYFRRDRVLVKMLPGTKA